MLSYRSQSELKPEIQQNPSEYRIQESKNSASEDHYKCQQSNQRQAPAPIDERIRLPHDQTVGDLAPAELLEKIWQASYVPEEDINALQELAAMILEEEVEEAAGEAEAEEETELEETKEVVPAQ